MIDALYTITIFPLEIVYKNIFLWLFSLVDNYGIALLLLSLFSFIFIKPLESSVSKFQKKELDLQSVINPQLAAIKAESQGAQAHQRIKNLYARYSYHPIYSLRTGVGLFVQVPFLMAAYFMLSSLEVLQNVPFLFINDLAKPDAFLNGINILPILMLIINIINVLYFYPAVKQERIQALVIAFLFFVLLYTAPSALLVYWTMNNILSLINNIMPMRINLSSFTHNIKVQKVKNALLPDMMSSTGLLLALSWFTPFYFVFSLNLPMFLHDKIISDFALICYPLFALFCYGIIIDCIQRILAKHSNNFLIPFNLNVFSFKNVNLKNILFVISNIILILVITYVVLHFTKTSFNLRDIGLRGSMLESVRILLILGIFVITKKYSLKIVNAFLLCFCLISFMQMNFVLRDNLATLNTYVASTELNPVDFPLENKPNIYILFLESFHDFETLENRYDISTDSMRKELAEHDFIFYEPYFVNYPTTLGSLAALFTLEADVGDSISGYSGASPAIRDVIGGSGNNILLSYLKELGYHTSIYYDINPAYYLFRRNLNIDTLYNLDMLDNMRVYKEINEDLAQIVEKYYSLFTGIKAKKRLGMKPMDAFYLEFDKILARKEPTFFLLKAGALHIPGVPPYTFEKDFPSFKEEYKDAIKKSYTEEIIPFIKTIEEKDPNAVVILLGDHGAWAIGDIIEWSRYTMNEMSQKLIKYNSTIKDFIHDYFGVVLAVKMPDYAKQDISYGKVLSTANLFRHIFASLDNNEAFLDGLVPNISKIVGRIYVREGKIVDEY